MCLAQEPQRSDTGEARTRGLSVPSQTLYHETERPRVRASVVPRPLSNDPLFTQCFNRYSRASKRFVEVYYYRVFLIWSNDTPFNSSYGCFKVKNSGTVRFQYVRLVERNQAPRLYFFPCYTQLNMKVQLLIKTKMLKNKDSVYCFKTLRDRIYHANKILMPTTIVGILIFMSRINFVLSLSKSFITLERVRVCDMVRLKLTCSAIETS